MCISNKIYKCVRIYVYTCVCVCGVGVCLVGWASGPSLAVPPGGWSAPPPAAACPRARQTDTRRQTGVPPPQTASLPGYTCSSKTWQHNHHTQEKRDGEKGVWTEKQSNTHKHTHTHVNTHTQRTKFNK